MANINLRDVNEDLRREFRIICVKHGLTMKDALTVLMSHAVEADTIPKSWIDGAKPYLGTGVTYKK